MNIGVINGVVQPTDEVDVLYAALSEKDAAIAELVAVLQSVQRAAWGCYSEARDRINQIKAGDVETQADAVDALQLIKSMHREYYDKARAVLAKYAKGRGAK